MTICFDSARSLVPAALSGHFGVYLLFIANMSFPHKYPFRAEAWL